MHPPSAAQAYVFNATVVPTGTLGYLTLWPDGEVRPVVSTLNALDGAFTSNMAVVPNDDGGIDAYTSGTTQLVLDISAYFAPLGSSGITGTWTMTATSTVTDSVFAGSAALTQTGSDATGTYTCTSSPTDCKTNASEAITGTVSGSTVILNIAQDCNGVVGTGTPVVLAGEVNSGVTTITGSYTIATNPTCNQTADTGTWSASLQ